MTVSAALGHFLRHASTVPCARASDWEIVDFEGIVRQWGPGNFLLHSDIQFELAFSHSQSRLVAFTTFGFNAEGPPGFAHGGAIAAWMDQVLGVLTHKSGHTSFTVKLEVEFKRKIPLQEIVQTNAWITKVEGRQVFIESRMTSLPTEHEAQAPVLANASGIFIKPRASISTEANL